MKLCECGCGQPAPIAEKTDRRYGFVKGQPKRFIIGHAGPRHPDLVGQRFGRLTIISFAESKKRNTRTKESYWLCRCDCGQEKVIVGQCLLKGATRSCGCLRRETQGRRADGVYAGFRHGMWRTPAYQSWAAMTHRCTNPKNPRWCHYGGAGVKVCERWQGEHGFENFYADMGPRPEGTSLGRFGDVGNYEPGNCKWMTPKEQGQEQRKKRSLTLPQAA